MNGAECQLKGVAASPGVAFGHAVTSWDPELVTLNYRLTASEVEPQVESLRRSVEKSRAQLEKIQRKLEGSTDPDSTTLIDAHLLILEDRLFIDRIIDKIRSERINAEWAIQAVSAGILAAYDRVHDDYLRDRRGDLEDVVRRLLFNLRAFQLLTFDSLRFNSILVGRTILPSTLIELQSPRLVGLVTGSGGPLAHTAILARSLGLPAVMGVDDVMGGLTSGELIIVDGDEGVVIRAPSEETIEAYRLRVREDAKVRRRHHRVTSAPCVTKDRISILLGTNINFKKEVDAAVAHECESIGLYRTEFDFYRDGGTPSEERLVEDYGYVLSHARNMAVNIRAVDADEQPPSDGHRVPRGRGLRFLLEDRDLFRTQLRAIYRASVEGQARILLPFVSTLDEIVQARRILADVRRWLSERGIPFDEDVPMGVMIETPAAAQTADLMASESDFLCLGTNDLIQYLLAIDRTDESSLAVYDPYHPAVLRALQQVQTLVQPTGKPIIVCGELAADPYSAAVLLGLGFTRLSVNVGAYPRIKRMIRSVSITELRALGEEILGLNSRDAIERRVRETLDDDL